jgi:hypothetical protein
MFRILEKFRGGKTVPLRELKALPLYVNYLLLRGYLFRCLSGDNEVLVMSRELLHVLEALDEAETGRTVKRNTAICKMGTSILCYYGVLDEGDFFLYLNTMFGKRTERLKHGFL